MSEHAELITRLEDRGQQLQDQSDRFARYGASTIAAEIYADMWLVRDAASALRALEAQSKDKEEGE